MGVMCPAPIPRQDTEFRGPSICPSVYLSIYIPLPGGKLSEGRVGTPT